MRQIVTAVICGAFALGAFTASAAEKTVTGELIDVQCSAKQGEKGKGMDHANCAMRCAKNGAKLGIAASDGVYVVTGDMTNDNNAKLLEYVAKQVEATGDVTETDGQKTINVASIGAAGKKM